MAQITRFDNSRGAPNINSDIAGLPTVLSDVRRHLATLSRTETLSADGAGTLMMIGRLLTMIEADEQLVKSEEVTTLGKRLLERYGLPDIQNDQQDGPDVAIVEALSKSESDSPERQKRLRADVLDRFLSIAAARQKQCVSVAASDNIDNKAATLDLPSRFAEYLSAKAGRVVRPPKVFHRITGGYSKTSIAVELEPGDDFGWGTRFLVRMDVKDGPTSFTVADEFPLLKKLHGSKVPVAQPFACERDSSILGQPFLVSGLVAGVSATSGDPTVALWGTDIELRHSLGVQLAKALGALHSVEVETAAPRLATDQVKSYLREWRQRWHELKAPSDPGLTVAFQWLEENTPKAIERIAYIHGDFAPYNVLQDSGRVTAVIDWEFVHLGDPAEDVGYCKKYIEALMPWDEFLKAYYKAGGPEYQSDSATYYEVWCNVRNAVVLLQGRQAYVSGRNRDIKVLYAPAEFYNYFLSNALQSIRNQL